MMKTIHSFSERANGLAAGLVTLVGWLVTCALGIVTIFDVRDIVLGLCLRLFAPAVSTSLIQAFSTALAAWSMFLWTIILIAYIFGSAEFAYRHVGRPRVWKLFAWVFGLEVMIIAVRWGFF
jgi:hypothetical protein